MISRKARKIDQGGWMKINKYIKIGKDIIHRVCMYMYECTYVRTIPMFFAVAEEEYGITVTHCAIET